MSSRAEILRIMAENQPEHQELPLIDETLLLRYADPVSAFADVLGKIGGKVIHVENEEEVLADLKEDTRKFVISTLRCTSSFAEQLKMCTAFDLAHLDAVYLRAEWGVAENGAVWIDERSMVNRLLPFITEHLVVVLNAANIVSTMHHAYGRIKIDLTGFGSFIAGPSKTADIEQSLVIGAHGPRRLTVYLIQD